MKTHATASRQWTEDELNQLMLEKDFRLRGLDTSRLDTFVDAAFAFVITLLVISFDELPSNAQELMDAAKRIPAFAASFAVLMMFWRKHRNWSRRYGLENSQTIFCSLMLIFAVLVYVYPLRMLFEGLFSHLSAGYLVTSYQMDTYADARMMFLFYSVGFVAMSLLILGLYMTVLKHKAQLALNDTELRKTKVEVQVSVISILFGGLSVALALAAPDNLITLAGYIYFSLIPCLFLPGYLDEKRFEQAATQ